MIFNDGNGPQDQATVTNTPPPQSTADVTAPAASTVQNDQGQSTPAASVAQVTPAQAPATPPPAQQPGPIARPVNTDPQMRMVSNYDAEIASHPAVKKASLMRSVFQALAGGPRYTETIDADGNRHRDPVPLTGRQIGMAIALEAISGSLTGLSAGRGRGPGAAGAVAFQQSYVRRQQEQQRQDEQAQKDADNRARALVGKAQIFEINSRTLLNTSHAEELGAEAIDKQIEINKASGVLDVDPDNTENGGIPMTQDEMLDAVKTGKIKATDQLGPIAGRVEVRNPDGSTRWEATHLVIRDPNSPMPISADDWNRYAAAHVPGWPPLASASTKFSENAEFPLKIKQQANEVLGSQANFNGNLNEIRNTLTGTQWADKVPAKLDYSKPGMSTAMQRFQKFVSHRAVHGMDTYESLMAAGTRDPNTGQTPLSSDRFNMVADAFGGLDVLKADHDIRQAQPAAIKARAEEEAKSGLVGDHATAANQRSLDRYRVLNPTARVLPAEYTVKPTDSNKELDRIDKMMAQTENAVGTKAQRDLSRAAQQTAADQHALVTQDRELAPVFGMDPNTGKQVMVNMADARKMGLINVYKPAAVEVSQTDYAREFIILGNRMQDVVTKLDKEGKLGPLASRYNDWLAGTYGAGDPDYQDLRVLSNLSATKLMQLHVGNRGGKDMLTHFKELVAAGKMDATTFRAGLNTELQYAKEVARDPNDLKARPPRPPGATMKVPGSDGKLHWSDGKQDLGVAQ